MTWLIFDEADHRIPTPNFCLPSVHGGTVCLRDFHEDSNLVIIFPGEWDPDRTRHVLENFSIHQPDYLHEEARILFILPAGLEEIQAVDRDGLSFLLLADPENKVRLAYSGLMAVGMVEGHDPMLFVLDRYNAPYAALIREDLSLSKIHDEIRGWLMYISVQCPE